jgi:hypothetical protein
MADLMDERLACHATDEGVDHIGIDNVWELIALLEEALNVCLEGLIGSLPVVAKIPRVPRGGV